MWWLMLLFVERIEFCLEESWSEGVGYRVPVWPLVLVRLVVQIEVWRVAL